MQDTKKEWERPPVDVKTLIVAPTIKVAAQVIERLRELHAKEFVAYDYDPDDRCMFARIKLSNGAKYMVLCEEYRDIKLGRYGKWDGIYIFTTSKTSVTDASKFITATEHSFVRPIRSSRSIEARGRVRCTYGRCKQWVRKSNSNWRCRNHASS